MKYLISKCTLALLALLFFSGLSAQTAPVNLNGTELRDWLKVNYHDNSHTALVYATARMYMYNYIDNNNDMVECVYSGYQQSWDYGGTGTNPDPINCEHTIPQSLFSSAYPMQSDLHHLFPTFNNWNSTRNNNPFNDITDIQTTKWMVNDTYQSTIPTSNIDEYSEYKSGVFEPREVHKGNLARAIFYFYTMYPSQAGDIGLVGDVNVLYQWHLNDPVDASEIARNNAIETYQNSRNPYIDDPSLIARAWVSTTEPTPSTPNSAASELIISDYVEGRSYNKAIELANMTADVIDLSAYTLRLQTNGAGSWGSDIVLSGEVAVGAVWVIANSNGSKSLRNRADALSASLVFNGNDPVGLFKNGTLIDIVGTFDVNTGFGTDKTLVRKASVTNPTTTFDSNEWEEYGKNALSCLGEHTFNIPTVIVGTDLIVSEYIEGSSYNKAIELANISGAAIDLSAYTLHKQTNGTGEWSSGFALSGNLSTGSTFVVVHASAGAELLALADISTSSSQLNFNGNDPIGLFKNGVLIDMVGVFDGGLEYFAQNVTLVRKGSVSSPTATYTINEWEEYAEDTFTDVGIHTMGGKWVLDLTTDYLRAYPNPVADLLTVNYRCSQSENIQLLLYNSNGKIVKQLGSFAHDGGNSEAFVRCWVGDLPQGFYVLHFVGASTTLTHKLIKK